MTGPDDPIAGFSEAQLREVVELMFYAYRDFTGRADAVLADSDMGRAHHRALHFIGRNPGITVAELLAILRITKQSLARVLNDLVARGHVVQQQGRSDRRQRHMRLSDSGEALLREVSAAQQALVAEALAAGGPEAPALLAKVLGRMIAAKDRTAILRQIYGPAAAGDGPGSRQ
ncbi:MAG: MarR family winged helix-turn-helix transcriptional regulator [Sneathiellaceae bacterium]